jgi:hypothetical protein
MSKHTPGPWEANSADNIYAAVNGRKEMIAKCCDLPCIGGHDDVAAQRARDMEIANARLIAAAPELLAALENIVAWMEQHHPEAAKNIPQARAAIAKVRGNTN